MLQAMIRNKARSFLMGGSQRSPLEDLMTDVVFGGLRYFDEAQAGLALGWLIPDLVKPGATLNNLRLWPRLDDREPDVVIDLTRPDLSRMRLIVEAKWQKNRLTRKQLDDQWQRFGADSPGMQDWDVQHVILLQHASWLEDSAYLTAPRDLQLVRHVHTWAQLCGAARVRPRLAGEPELHRWIEDVIQVVMLHDRRPFSGWSDVLEVLTQVPFFSGRFWTDDDLRVSIADQIAFFDGQQS